MKTHHFRCLALGILLTLAGPGVRAQQAHLLTGTVLDRESWEPLPGVAVLETGTQNAALTDAGGHFMLKSAAPIRSVSLSLLGYHPRTIELSQQPDGEGGIIIYMQQRSEMLGEVTVSGFGGKRPLHQTAGGIATLNAARLEQHGPSSPVAAMNTLPGVRMEERAPGSYRLNIRGNLLRSPFGVRNVKVYWNGMPFTQADGNTYLNLLDLSRIGAAEVIKGSAGSAYGAGTGGALLLESPKPDYGRGGELKAGFAAGSYGLLKADGGLQLNFEKGNLQAGYSRQLYGGYRRQSALKRHAAYASGNWYAGKHHKLSASLLAADLYYELPGGLTQEQYETDPRQARPGSEAQNASIDHQVVWGGLGHSFAKGGFSWQTSVYASGDRKDNPFNTNYKEESGRGGGFRTEMGYRMEKAAKFGQKWGLELRMGAELQAAAMQAAVYGNQGGLRDTLQFDDAINPLQFLVFGQARLLLPYDFRLVAGVGVSRQKYGIGRTDHAGAFAESNITFNAVASPRFALIKQAGENLSFHASVSWGFSPPTLDEVRTSEGSLNTDLQAERAVNYETGFRGGVLGNRLRFEANVYRLTLRNAIVSRLAEDGTVLFSNAGGSRNYGVEASVSHRFFDDFEKPVSLLAVWAAYTYRHAQYYDYRKETDVGTFDFSGRQVAGTPPHVLSAGVDLAVKIGFYVHMDYNYTHRIPLNDANVVYGTAYHLLNTRLGFRHSLFGRFTFDAYAGANNLLDQTYSLGNDLNAFGGRYYQPAPDRNFYGGLSLALQFGEKGGL